MAFWRSSTPTCTCMRFIGATPSSRNLAAFLARGPALRRGGARILRAFAAVFSEIAEQRIHRFEARRVDHRTAVPAHAHQARHAQAVEMKGERIGRELENAGDLACGHSFRSGLHQQPEYVETIILGERSKSCDGIRLFHNSTNIELFARCQEL